MDSKHTGIQFRFRKNDNIGSPEAESDESYLAECFVDTGDLDVLRDFSDTKRIIVGRTGAGKSALVRKLVAYEDHVIELKPENLALNFLANSMVLRFFEEAGTQLDVFYQLLWKHVLAVELIRCKYRITNETAQRSFLERFSSVFSRDRPKEQAIEYLRQWGANFWNETESRVREVTTKIESDLRASISGTAAGAKLDAGGSEKLSAEEKREVVQRGSRAVSQVQLAALSNVLRLLEEEIFSDAQEGYFVVIDDLDTRWVDDGLKFKLIRALIETVRAFRQVRRVKVVVAIRLDLLQRVITATRDSGFQSEKYEPLYLRLRWTAPQLVELVSKRLSRLVRQRYTSRAVTLDEVFPREIQKSRFADFLSDRTSLRPRDAILFLNECLARAVDRQQVTAQMVLDAEAAYSEKRIDSLQEEWSGVYPRVSDYIKILSRKPSSFPVSELSRNVLEDWAMSTLLDDADSSDPVAKAARHHFLDGKGTTLEFVLVLLDALYAVGVVGIKTDPTTACSWSFYSDHRPAPGSIRPSSVVQVQPAFWRGLGVRAI
ncbi:MAG: DNA repair protein [Burkholderiaceae bacterium]|nr:DNA repair protein [Burkholderiaceae bacterium]